MKGLLGPVHRQSRLSAENRAPDVAVRVLAARRVAAHKSMSPRRRVALIQTYGGSRIIRNRAGRFVAPPCITIRSFHVVEVPISPEEKTDSASSTPEPCGRSDPSTKTAGNCHLGSGELELIQPQMAQKPVLRGEVGCACAAREVSVARGGMGERGYARRFGVGCGGVGSGEE